MIFLEKQTSPLATKKREKKNWSDSDFWWFWKMHYLALEWHVRLFVWSFDHVNVIYYFVTRLTDYWLTENYCENGTEILPKMHSNEAFIAVSSRKRFRKRQSSQFFSQM